MIRKKLLFVPLLFGFVLGMVSCLDGENKSTYRSAAVIVDNHTTGGVTMSVPYYGTIFAPELKDVNDGDCIYASYAINFDKQPSPERYTATDIQYQVLPKREVRIETGSMINEYNDSILGIQLSTNLAFYGNLFVQTLQKGPNGQQYELELICNPDSIDANGINTVFLKSKASKGVNGNLIDIETMEAFNLNPLISAYGKDTLISEQRYRILSLNFKYQIGDDDGEPLYRLFNDRAIEVAIAASSN